MIDLHAADLVAYLGEEPVRYCRRGKAWVAFPVRDLPEVLGAAFGEALKEGSDKAAAFAELVASAEHEDGQLIFNCPWPEEDFA